MLTKIVGHGLMTEMMKKLRGGPQSMLPGAPVKGSGAPNRSGLTPQAPRNYVTPKQAPTQIAKPKLGLATTSTAPAVVPPAAPGQTPSKANGRWGLGVAKNAKGRPKFMKMEE